ncbi:hypothetical protein [uncultured Bacteroides sp.]|uniref:beta strand repeat-containing protein n=1 Tax=uncultured Bacteroides sp. TaxID=162156 RepID=UPI002AA73853|nr:hypothetical protein [uncultured Bacteroides sp.]
MVKVKFKNAAKTGTTAPLAASLDYGEININYKKGNEKIFIKNDANEVVGLNDFDVLINKPQWVDLLSVDGNGNLKIDANVYSTGELSAFGSATGGTGGGGGLISSVLDSSDLGGAFLDTDYDNTFNAFTINSINSNVNSATARIATLEGGSATSISTVGSGNVVTSLSKAGTTITATKGLIAVLEGDSRLTDARKNPNSLTFSGYSTLNYDGSLPVTIPIPTKVSQLTNDSAFLTSINKSQVEAALQGVATGHTHNQYLTGNQTVTLSGDATGNGTTAIAVTLANVGTAGTYKSVTTDSKGRVISGTNPTTLAGYGITDALPAAGGTISGNLAITGNLTLNGSTTTINSTTVTIDDPVFQIGGDTLPTSDDNKDRGIQFNYYTTTGKTGFFGFDDSTGYFTFIPDAVNTGEVFSGSQGDIQAANFRGNLIGSTATLGSTLNVTGAATLGSTLNVTSTVTAPTFVGALSGNAATVTKLATPRNIALTGVTNGNVNFDGSGNVTIGTTISNDSITLGTHTVGNYAGSVAVSGTGLSLTGAAGEGTAYTITSNATNANTASTVVARDSSGNFSAGTITASLSGNATTSSKATQIMVGTCVVAAATVQKDVILSNFVLEGGAKAIIKFTYQACASATLNINGTGAKNIYYNGSLTSAASWADGDLVEVQYDGTQYHIIFVNTDNSTAKPVLAGDVTGNAATTTKLAIARTLTISGTGISSTGGSFDGSGNVAIAMSIDTIDCGTW